MDDRQSVSAGGEAAAASATAGDAKNERPLVTFALFAYNQEKYIREAVEGAFSQTYEPLEIILSDDCSTDRTFEIMQEMAAAYRGPHQVRVRRNEVNFGIGKHVQAALQEARGIIYVLGAGDDVSERRRVCDIVDIFFLDTNCKCVCSDATDYVSGEIIRSPAPGSLSSLTSGSCYVLGATAAYSRDTLTRFPPLHDDVHHEDSALALRSLILGTIRYIETPLVRYRKNTGVSSGYSGSLNCLYRQKDKKEIERRLALINQWEIDLKFMNLASEEKNIEKMKTYYSYLYYLTNEKYHFGNFMYYTNKVGIKAVLYELSRYKCNSILRMYVKLRHRVLI